MIIKMIILIITILVTMIITYNKLSNNNIPLQDFVKKKDFNIHIQYSS